MKPLKYSQLMPKTAIEKLKLLEIEEECENLIGRDIEYIRSELLDSPYKEDLLATSQDDGDSTVLEKALHRNYMRIFEKLINFSFGDIKELLSALLKKFEVSNVKSMLRTTKAGMDANEALTYIIPAGRLDEDRCRKILTSSKTVEGVIEALSDLEYGPILREVFQEHQKDDGLFPLELALDQAVYNGIKRKIEDLRGRDKTVAEEILGIEMDAINVKIILRCKRQDIPPDQIQDYLIPPALITRQTFKEAIKATDVKSMMEKFLTAQETVNKPSYQNLFTKLLEEHAASLSRLELILDEARVKTSLHMMKKYTKYYNVGFILAFLNLKWVEIKNLRCIIKGSERQLSYNQIRKLLILPSKE
ncbi:MAG: V-type ATPase subunit [Thermoproteota archaeon]